MSIEPVFNFQTFPVLTTSRLVLRELTESDTGAVFAIRSDFAVTRHNIGPAYRNHSDAAQLIESIRANFRDKTELRWGIALRESNRIIGMCGFNYWMRVDDRAAIGYDLAQAHWRRGYMSEAIRVIIRFGFEQMALNRIEADCSLDNTASIALLKKLGFQQEGHQREQYYDAHDGCYHDLLLFALLRREWLSQTGP